MEVENWTMKPVQELVSADDIVLVAVAEKTESKD